jgi:hypothetical protein
VGPVVHKIQKGRLAGMTRKKGDKEAKASDVRYQVRDAADGACTPLCVASAGVRLRGVDRARERWWHPPGGAARPCPDERTRSACAVAAGVSAQGHTDADAEHEPHCPPAHGSQCGESCSASVLLQCLSFEVRASRLRCAACVKALAGNASMARRLPRTT